MKSTNRLFSKPRRLATVKSGKALVKAVLHCRPYSGKPHYTTLAAAVPNDAANGKPSFELPYLITETVLDDLAEIRLFKSLHRLGIDEVERVD